VFTLKDLFEQFIKERIYLKNVTPKTVYFHRQAWISFSKQLPEITTIDQLSKPVITDYLVKLRESGIKTVSVNTYCRSLNAFFAWLLENELIEVKLKIPKLPTEKYLIKILPEDNLRALLSFKPSNFGERRIHTICLMIIDTGMRIDEALSLKVGDIDLHNLISKVKGKGRKERLVPFSFELRKILTKFLRFYQVDEYCRDPYLFCNRDGGKTIYSNLRRDYISLCEKLGIPKLGAFHRMRHTFATNYVKTGGNVLYLQKVLGHTELSTTEIYVEAETESLKETQLKTSILERLTFT
jgi:integrase/recombinase XerD